MKEKKSKSHFIVTTIFFTIFFMSKISLCQINLQYTIQGDTTNNLFGLKVFLSENGNRLAVGSNIPNSNQKREIKVFENNGNDWVQIGDAIEGEAFFNQEISFALSSNGDRIIVGFSREDDIEEKAGQVRVYEFQNGNWSQIGNTFFGEEQEESFGVSVDISDDGQKIVIGAPNKNFPPLLENVGQTMVYNLENGEWVQLGSTIFGETNYEYSGFSVSLSPEGNLIAIGAPNLLNPNFINQRGAVRIFELLNNEWMYKGNIIFKPVAPNAGFGGEVDFFDENTIIVGTPTGEAGGEINIHNFDGIDWNLFKSFSAPNIMYQQENTGFGNDISTSISGNKIVFGAPYELDNGSVHIHQFNGDVWENFHTLNGVDLNDSFGSSVSISGNGLLMAVGVERKDNIDFQNIGEVLIYEISTTSTELPPKKNELITLFPNPTSGQLNIKEPISNLDHVEIRNNLGQLIQIHKNMNEINLKNLIPGTYIVHIITKKSIYSGIVVKQNN